MHYLYILSSGEFTKIGITENFQKRFSSYRQHNPGISKVKIYSCDTPSTAIQIEDFVIKRLEKFSVGYAREWFRCQSFQVDACIQKLFEEDPYFEVRDDGSVKHLNPSIQPVRSPEKMSFHERLSALPDLFSLNTMVKVFGMKRSVALRLINHWKGKGYIEAYGVRTALYFNTHKNKNAKNEKWYNALKEIYPEAVYAGVEALRQEGWVTQISQREEIVVRNRNFYHAVDEIEWMPRSIYWFRRYKEGMLENGPKKYLKASYALVDLCEQGKYIPDPDDLFLDDGEIEEIKQTFLKLNVDVPKKLWEVLEFSPEEKPSPKRRRASL